MIQLTIIKINGYGPWTLTLGSDREHKLQMLQASLYKELQNLFSEKQGIVFLNRSDEFFAVTNGLTLEDHTEIQKKIAENFDLKLTMSVGSAETPYEANLQAYKSAKQGDVLDMENNIYGFLNGKAEEQVTIMHIDVDDITSKRNTRSPYEISNAIFDLYSKMSKFFMERRSMTFFMGGDNFMVVADKEAKKSVKDFLDNIRKENGIILNCGIGTGKTGREAVKLATESLDTIRKIRDEGKEKPEIYELPCS